LKVSNNSSRSELRLMQEPEVEFGEQFSWKQTVKMNRRGDGRIGNGNGSFALKVDEGFEQQFKEVVVDKIEVEGKVWRTVFMEVNSKDG
jgi:hypothetical protein